MPGKGCFVANKNPALVREEHLKRIEELFGQAVQLARQAGIPAAELAEMLQLQFEGE